MRYNPFIQLQLQSVYYILIHVIKIIYNLPSPSYPAQSLLDTFFKSNTCTHISKASISSTIYIYSALHTIVKHKMYGRSSSAVGWSVRPASGRLGVRIPAATDLRRKKGSDSSTAKRSAIVLSVTGPRR